MTRVSTVLIHQIRHSQRLGQAILDLSGLGHLNIGYVYATRQTLVINCKDYQSAWLVDEGQIDLRNAMRHLGLSIQNICVEKDARRFCEL